MLYLQGDESTLTRMRPLALGSLVAVTLVTLLGAVLAEKVCYFSQEPDPSQNGRLRWVLPGSKSDYCRCTSIWPGPLYTKPLQRSQEPFYTDTPIFTSDQEEIHHYFDCHDPCSPNPCQNGGTCSPSGGSFQCQCEPGFNGTSCEDKPLDCEALFSSGVREGGVYTIYPRNYPNGLEVYCDMDNTSGGWIVFQKRFDGLVNFTRNWTEYRDGFGNLTGEFWLGNEKLRQLTSEYEWLLQINLAYEDPSYSTPETSYWWIFRVVGYNYSVNLEGLVGNSPLPSSQTSHPFSTYDKDNDGEDHLNCAALTRGGWWFDQCEPPQDSWSNLNGEYFLPEDSTDSYYRGIRLADDWADFEVAGRTEMKLRRFLPNGSCNSEPCENGGTCLESDSSFYCQCAPGFLRTRCEDHLGDPCSSDLCQNGGTCYQRQSRQYCQCAPGFRGEHCQRRPEGCRSFDFRGIRQSGVYTIYPSKYPDGLEVYCDMDTASRGWIVFQKRFDGSVNFTRNWTEYRNGFGDLTGEFWLGNEKLRQLTSEKRWRVRIDLEDDLAEHQTYQAKRFGISGDKYTWTHRKRAHHHQALSQLDGRSFSTYDMDNDEDTNANCAAELKGGWWLDTCNGTSGAPYGLNGEYQQGPNDRSIIWAGWKGHRIVKCEMKLRLYKSVN